jgi:hypothetical protein
VTVTDTPGWRRWPRLALGAAWLLDAALQVQPCMFTRGFAAQVLAPAGQGSPALVTGAVHAAARLVLASPALLNAAFAGLQLAIGAGLMWRRASRVALAAGVAWALGVWTVGEGLGGLATGSASPVTGAPGAALLYALIAVLAWPSARRAGRRQRAGRASWAALWGGSAVLMLQPASLAAGALRGAVAGQAHGEPGWVAGLDRVTAAAIGGHGTAISVALAVAFALTGAGALLPRTARPALAAGMLAALAMWAAGQDFGGILTGQGTDPGTGPLVVLLAAMLWPARTFRPSVAGPARAPADAAARPAGAGTAAAENRAGTAVPAAGSRARLSPGGVR